ncbi:MAG: hypothetical protein ABEJ26_10040 [Halosimplex sp.]
MSRIRRLLADWEFWQAVALVALAAWVAARSARIWLIDSVQSATWAAHGVLALVPQTTVDQARTVVDGFVALAFPVAVGSFLCGFLAFHADAEARRRREADER